MREDKNVYVNRSSEAMLSKECYANMKVKLALMYTPNVKSTSQLKCNVSVLHFTYK